MIVLASDGLFNNMYKTELTEMLKDFKVSAQNICAKGGQNL